MDVGGRTVLEPRVLPYVSNEIQALCAYRVERASPKDARDRNEMMAACKRAQASAQQERVNDCRRTVNSHSPTYKQALEACVRDGTSFARRFESLKQFDDYPSLAGWPDLVAYARRLKAASDELSLLPAVQARMHAHCAQAAPPAGTDRSQWQRMADEHDLAGPGGACATVVATARAALAGIDEAEAQAARERAIAEQRETLGQATSWLALARFVDRYREADVGGLMAAATERLATARAAEIAAMQAMPLDRLEPLWRERKEMPDELHALARARLIEESVRAQTFAGARRAYRVSGDIEHIARAQHLVRSPADRLALEAIAVKATAQPERFFAVSFEGAAGESRQREQRHAGVFALYTMHGSFPVSGTVKVQRAAKTPGPLTLGRYRVDLVVELVMTRRTERRSRVLGNKDTQVVERLTRNVSIIVGPPQMSGQAAVDFGTLNAVRLERGSQGGLEQEWLDGEPTVQVSIVSITALNEELP